MHFLFYGSIAGSAIHAAKELGHSVEALPYKAKTLEDVMFGHALISSTPNLPADFFVSSANVNRDEGMAVIKQRTPSIIVWDLGTDVPIKADINRIIVPLQLMGYTPSMLKGMSSHLLGYNYKQDRYVVIAKKGKEPAILPAKIHIKKPFTPLSAIIRAEGDALITPFISGRNLYHQEPRGWNFVSRPLGNDHLQAHPLSLKVGSVWYGIDGKLHRLTVSEAAAIVGYPPALQTALMSLCPDTGLAIYTILRDLPTPVWKDLFERTR